MTPWPSWATGAQSLAFDEVQGPWTYPTAIQCSINGAENRWALLDSGSTYCILSGESAVLAAQQPNTMATTYTQGIETRDGKLDLPFLTVNVELPATYGSNLLLEVPVMWSPEKRTFPDIVLGVRGFLDRLRIATAPATQPDQDGLLYYALASNPGDPISQPDPRLF